MKHKNVVDWIYDHRIRKWIFLVLLLGAVLFAFSSQAGQRELQAGSDMNRLRLEVNEAYQLLEGDLALVERDPGKLKEALGGMDCTITDLTGTVRFSTKEEVAVGTGLDLAEALYQDDSYLKENSGVKEDGRLYSRNKLSLPVMQGGVTVGFAIFEKERVEGAAKQEEGRIEPLILASLLLVALVLLGIPILFPKRRPYGALEEGLALIGKGVLRPIEPEMIEGEIRMNGEAYRHLLETYNLLVADLADYLEKQGAADSKKKAFLTKISHELKTPVATINAYVEGLVKGVAKDEETRQKYIGIINEKMQRLIQQIEELFLYAQEESEQFKYQLEECYADELFSGILDQLKHQSVHPVQVDDFLPKVLLRADKVRLEQVLLNLFNNAVKHSNIEEPIKIRAYRQENEILIEVEDGGEGIDARDLPYIFDYYYQGTVSRKKDYEGIGLGLAICKEIISRHGGQIKVRSKIGQGTTMTVILPIL